MVKPTQGPLVLNWLTNQPTPLLFSNFTPPSPNNPQTGSYTVQPTDFLSTIISGAGSTLTLTLPASILPDGFVFHVIAINNDIILSPTIGDIAIPDGSDGIFASSYTLSASNQFQGASIFFDGDNFLVFTTQGTGQLLSVDCLINGGGVVITSGNKGWIRIPVAMNIFGWNVSADQSGSIAVDILTVNAGAISGATSIVGTGNKPTLSSQQFAQALTSGWTTTQLFANDWVVFDVTGTPTSVQAVTVDLACQRL